MTQPTGGSQAHYTGTVLQKFIEDRLIERGYIKGDANVRHPALVRHSGPYRCESRIDGTILVRPRWPQFQPYTEEEGGGPGVFSRMGLANDLESWLNHICKEPPA